MASALTEELGFEIPVGARDFSSLQNVQTGSGTHPSSYSKGAGPRPEVSHTSASSAGVKSEWNYTSTPPYAFIVRTGTLSFFLIHNLGEMVTVHTPSFVFLQTLLNKFWWSLIFDL